jgi:hypothetical protein
MLASLLVYGVMVTQLFLVQSFKVRVLVDQQKTSSIEEVFLWAIVKYGLNKQSLSIFLKGFVCV